MTTIRDYIKKCEFVTANLLAEQARIVAKKEIEILRLNTRAFEAGVGSDGNTLRNSNSKFSGRYTVTTQILNPKKTAGELYDFNETGDFLRGLQANLQPDTTKLDIFSTGTGSADKKAFFDGYYNLLGLDKKNTDIVNYEIIYPELMKFIKKYL